MREREPESRLAQAIDELWALARKAGLEPAPVVFELVPAAVLHELAAYGLPGRFRHWSRGKAYRLLQVQHELGLAKWFELVINTRPAHAFLLETNDLLTHKFVVAHVLGHADFFAGNAHFAGVDPGMAERAELHAERLRRYAFTIGPERVEAFLDAVLAIEEHVDPRAGAEAQAGGAAAGAAAPGPVRGAAPEPVASLFPRAPLRPAAEHGPPDGCADLLLFLLRHAPHLEDWQRDVLAMVRDEALYLRPQARTKITNEGWATLWHTRLLRALELDDAEYLDFARLNATVRGPQPATVNPYMLGVAVYEDLLQRYGEGEGLRRCFEARTLDDDLSFLRNHFTREVAERLDLGAYGSGVGPGRGWRAAAGGYAEVRAALLQQVENGGRPVVVAADADHGGRRELLLRHRHDGRDLEQGDAERTLRAVASVWGRACHLQTVLDGQPRTLRAEPPSG